MSPLVALKNALRTRILADAPVVALLGGPHVFDETPRGAPTPYAVFGDAACRDNGTVSDAGHISDLTLAVWSRQGGTREALLIADSIAGLIDDADMTLDGHRLIQCRVTATEIRRQADKELTRATLRIRAVTEVI